MWVLRGLTLVLSLHLGSMVQDLLAPIIGSFKTVGKDYWKGQSELMEKRRLNGKIICCLKKDWTDIVDEYVLLST